MHRGQGWVAGLRIHESRDRRARWPQERRHTQQDGRHVGPGEIQPPTSSPSPLHHNWQINKTRRDVKSLRHTQQNGRHPDLGRVSRRQAARHHYFIIGRLTKHAVTSNRYVTHSRMAVSPTWGESAADKQPVTITSQNTTCAIIVRGRLRRGCHVQATSRHVRHYLNCLTRFAEGEALLYRATKVARELCSTAAKMRCALPGASTRHRSCRKHCR